VGLHGYFGNPDREMLVLAGFVLLIWLPALRCPAAVAGICGVLAEASLYIYLTHYQVYPLAGGHPLLGVVLSLATGVALTRLVMAVRKRMAGRPAGLPTTSMLATRAEPAEPTTGRITP
jgi:hypothetical protein